MLHYHEILRAYHDEHVQDSSAQIWGRKLSDDGRIYELTDVPPLTFISDGSDLPDYRIYGNTLQSSEPSPENPAAVLGCGERTENLLDLSVSNWEQGTIMTGGNRDGASTRIRTKGKMAILPNTDYTVRAWGDVIPAFHLWKDNNYISDSGWITNQEITFNTGNANLIEFVLRNVRNIYAFTTDDLDGTRLVQLSPGTIPSGYYIPYGCKIPVTVTNGTETVTTPVYTGSEPLHRIGDYADYVDFQRGVIVRRIKKLVLTGNETFIRAANGTFYGEGLVRDYAHQNINICVSTHYISQENASGTVNVADKRVSFHLETTYNRLYVRDTDFLSADAFKACLATQYEAGTPVTVWYVLAEPEEEPLENLLPIQTLKGTNILTVAAEVQPSEMYIKYRK